MRHVIYIILSVAVIAFAFHFAKPLENLPQKEEFLPKANYAKAIAVGHNVTAAGLFWINGLIDLGDSYISGQSYAWLSHVGNLSTELDSLFKTPYAVVGSVTNTDEKDTTDFAVMRRAIRVYPENWKFAIYLALRLANGPTHNYAEAAEVMRPFSTNPDTTIPAHIKTIYRNFELNSMQTEMAVELLVNDALNPSNKGLLGSLYPKAMRVLHRTWADSVEVKEIKSIMQKLTEHSIDPAYAYNRLLSLKKEDSNP